jgi:hypothetical protein
LSRNLDRMMREVREDLRWVSTLSSIAIDFALLSPLPPSGVAPSLSKEVVSGLFAVCGKEVKCRENGLQHGDTDRRAG